MSDLKIPFGRRKNDGKLVEVDEVANGINCNCVCPDPTCKYSLVATHGDAIVHHFRHEPGFDSTCRGVAFSFYEMARELISERKKLTLPEYSLSVSANDSKGQKHTEKEIITQNTVIDFDSVKVFQKQEDVDLTKLSLSTTKEDSQFTIVIDLSKSKDVFDKEGLWDIINNPKNITIINYKNLITLEELHVRLNEKVAEQEEKYKEGAIEKEKLRLAEEKGIEEEIKKRSENRKPTPPESYSISRQNSPAYSFSNDHLSSLNPAQRQAVETTEGPVLVLAGAGTGKTRVLTSRLAHILRSNKAFPGQILAVTFTNKAAQEMKHRVSTLLGGAPVEGWWLGTFHALAARMLRRHADLVGLTSSFTILDQDDQVRLIKQLMEAENIDTKKWAPRTLAAAIDRWKDRAMMPADITQNDAKRAVDATSMADGKLAQIYAQYQQRLKTLNACDFGDLLLHMIHILKDPRNKDVQEDYHRRFKYVLVDEYQDTNVAQWQWLRLLTNKSYNICCVGDDDQSIYGWRGAEVENILRFEKDFPGAVVIRLEENYRSTAHILAAANGVIAHNEGRLGKELFTSIGAGEKVKVRGLWDGEAEARWVGEEIESLQNKKYGLDDMAVLVRAGFQTREFEERFIQLGLPYRVIGGPRFYEREEIRDALAYLRVVNQKNDDLALGRIINKPKRSLGEKAVQTLQVHARAKNISLYDSILDLTQTQELQPKARTSLMKLIDDFERWRGMVSNTHHAGLTNQILDESGYTDMWKADKSPDSPGRLENLKELVSGMEEFESLPVFLEHVSLVMENQNNQTGQQITIMTLHGAKGLEFKCVFLVGWEEGLFPSQRSMDENGLKGLEEERRLAYVGITRARERSYISHAANRRMYGSWMNTIPSRFVDELPEDHIEVEAEQGLYGSSGRSQHWDSSGFGDRFARRGAPVPDNSSFAPTQNASGFSRGDRVFHGKFGTGKIINMDGGKLDIAFEKAGTKRVLDSFVTKAD